MGLSVPVFSWRGERIPSHRDGKSDWERPHFLARRTNKELQCLEGKIPPQDIPLCPGSGDMRLSIPAGPSWHLQCLPQPWGCTIEGFGVTPRAQAQLGEL